MATICTISRIGDNSPNSLICGEKYRLLIDSYSGNGRETDVNRCWIVAPIPVKSLALLLFAKI